MNDSGIIAQYGFLYQRKAFMLYAMRHAGAMQLFTFEGRDDPEERMPYIMKLTQRGLERIVTTEKKVITHADTIIKTGLSALISAAIKLVVAA